jgi:hypothetical protein
MRTPLPSDAQIITGAKQALALLHAGNLRDAKLAVAPLVEPFERAGLTLPARLTLLVTAIMASDPAVIAQATNDAQVAAILSA